MKSTYISSLIILWEPTVHRWCTGPEKKSRHFSSIYYILYSYITLHYTLSPSKEVFLEIVVKKWANKVLNWIYPKIHNLHMCLFLQLRYVCLPEFKMEDKDKRTKKNILICKPSKSCQHRAFHETGRIETWIHIHFYFILGQ